MTHLGPVEILRYSATLLPRDTKILRLEQSGSGDWGGFNPQFVHNFGFGWQFVNDLLAKAFSPSHGNF